MYFSLRVLFDVYSNEFCLLYYVFCFILLHTTLCILVMSLSDKFQLDADVHVLSNVFDVSCQGIVFV